MTDYISRCAELRPLVTRTQLKEIFPTDRWDEHKFGGKFGVQFYFGPSALTAPDGTALNVCFPPFHDISRVGLISTHRGQ